MADRATEEGTTAMTEDLRVFQDLRQLKVWLKTSRRQEARRADRDLFA